MGLACCCYPVDLETVDDIAAVATTDANCQAEIQVTWYSEAYGSISCSKEKDIYILNRY